MGRYNVLVLDEHNQRLEFIHEPISPEYRRRANQATTFSFGVLADDEYLSALQAAKHCILYRDGIEKASGYITARDFSSNPYRIECMTNEALLRRIIVPREWTFWNNFDLADAVRDLCLGYRTGVQNTHQDWLGAVERNNVDLDTEPGKVVLAKNEAGAYFSHGYITVQFDLGEIIRYDLLRWSEDVGDAVRIRVQFRTSPDAINWTAWTDELASVFPDEDGVALTGNDRYIQVRFHLYTDDTRTKDPNGIPTGYTPILAGAEVIARVQGPVVADNVPEATGVTVQGYTFNRDSALRVLQTWCEDYGYEFRVDSHKRLHFDKQLGQETDVLLRRTSSMNIQRLSDKADNLQNVVLCLGAGEGSAQLQTMLRDEDSIVAYGEELPGIFEDAEIETVDDLIAAGQKYLAANAWPKEEFIVTNVPVWDMEDFNLYDTVTVVDPLRGVVTKARILDEERKFDTTGEVVTLGLNTTLDNVIEKIVKRQTPKLARAPSMPSPPIELRTMSGAKSIRLRWAGSADYWRIECSVDDIGPWTLLESEWRSQVYVHGGLVPGETRWYRIIAVQYGLSSTPSGPIAGQAGYVEPEELDRITKDGRTGVEDNALVTTDGVSARAIIGDISGRPWEGTPLPAGTYGIWTDNGYFSGKLAAGIVEAKHYKNIRNYWSEGNVEPISPDHPIEFRFHIPSETVNIVAIRLSAYAERFRAYATGAASGGGTLITAEEDGLHDHELTSYTGLATSTTALAILGATGSTTTGISIADHDQHDHGNSLSVDSYTGDTGSASDTFVSSFSNSQHSHTVDIQTLTTSSEWPGVAANFTDHTHGMSHGHGLSGSIDTASLSSHSITDPGHTHGVGTLSVAPSLHGHTFYAVGHPMTQRGSHTHEITLPDHTHSLVYGIYENTTPAEVKVYCSDGTDYGQAISLAAAPLDEYQPYALATELNLTSQFTGSGWKTIKFTSSRLGRINYKVIFKIDIDA